KLKKAQDKLAYLRTVLLVPQYKQIYDSKYRNKEEENEINEDKEIEEYKKKEAKDKNKEKIIVIDDD
ncbi:25732_t:CDS:1, partial [Gigaspora rosea]